MTGKRCQQKRRYPSRVDAEIAGAAIHARGKDGGRAYRCPICCGWHLTGQARRHRT